MYKLLHNVRTHVHTHTHTRTRFSNVTVLKNRLQCDPSGHVFMYIYTSFGSALSLTHAFSMSLARTDIIGRAKYNGNTSVYYDRSGTWGPAALLDRTTRAAIVTNGVFRFVFRSRTRRTPKRRREILASYFAIFREQTRRDETGATEEWPAREHYG